MSLLGEKPTSAFLPLCPQATAASCGAGTKNLETPRAGGEWGCVPLLARSQVYKPCPCLVEPSEVVTLAQWPPGMRSLADPSVCCVAPELHWALGAVVPEGLEREPAQELGCLGLKAACMLPLLLFLNTLRSLRFPLPYPV